MQLTNDNKHILNSYDNNYIINNKWEFLTVICNKL